MTQRNSRSLKLIKILNLLSYPIALIFLFALTKIYNIFKPFFPWFALIGIFVIGFNHWFITQAEQRGPKYIEKGENIDNKKKYSQSYIKMYWFIWVILLSILVCLKMFFRNLTEDQLDNAFMSYMLIVWIPIMFLNFFEGHRLYKYLKRYHYEKWQYFTSIGSFSLANFNSIRFIPFLFSKENLNDPIITKIKANYKKFIVFAIIVFFSFIPVSLFIMMF